MKIIDAVYTAAVFLQLDDLCDAMTDPKFDPANPDKTLDADGAKELSLLVRCCNLVLHELSESGFPLIAVCSAEVKDGKFYYADLTHEPREIISVEKNGRRVMHRDYYDCVTVNVSGKCQVTYSFEPPEATLDGNAAYENGKPSARLTAYGIAREYCLISGMTDDAATWDSRFTACLEDESMPKRGKRVRARVWR